jgi:hypothetical protein
MRCDKFSPSTSSYNRQCRFFRALEVRFEQRPFLVVVAALLFRHLAQLVGVLQEASAVAFGTWSIVVNKTWHIFAEFILA